jgi:PhzF family phenazine biosynthesis protein
MNTAPYYQVDAFTDTLFSGNPAGVCLLDSWLPDITLQKIAQENNLSETAFLVPRGDEYALRWFTPAVEVDLCGHATLASAFVLLSIIQPERQIVRFQTASGELTVVKSEQGFEMNFPALTPQPVKIPDGIAEALGVTPIEAFCATDLFLVLESESQVKSLAPVHEQLVPFSDRGVVVTARGESCDFVSRAFFPAVGIPEDPVTGSTHCVLTPYWASKLDRSELSAHQLSERSGIVGCSLQEDRVKLRGNARLYLTGELCFSND